MTLPAAIRDAVFTTDSTGGASVTAQDDAPPWAVPEFGSTTNDDRLEAILKSIRWSVGNVTASVPVTAGRLYQVQLIFQENGSAQGFDVWAEGTKIADDFSPANVQGGRTVTNRGAVLTYRYLATDATLDMVLQPPGGIFADPNPILNALTVEDLGPSAPAMLAVRTDAGTLTLAGFVGETSAAGLDKTGAGRSLCRTPIHTPAPPPSAMAHCWSTTPAARARGPGNVTVNNGTVLGGTGTIGGAA